MSSVVQATNIWYNIIVKLGHALVMIHEVPSFFKDFSSILDINFMVQSV
jgi:hypothetical protein